MSQFYCTVATFWKQPGFDTREDLGEQGTCLMSGVVLNNPSIPTKYVFNLFELSSAALFRHMCKCAWR